VAADEREGGLRAVLNYGHTFGHVVEALCGYGTWLHGEAVALGMVAVGELAVQRGNWSRIDAERQKQLIAKSGLPTTWPELNHEAVLQTLQGDKKVRDGQLRFVIPTGVGSVEIQNDIGRDEITHCLELLAA
jgi:3-dehydroquinate synthase